MSKKRLKRNSRGSIILPNGQRITLKEQNELISAVNSANRKRKRLLAQMPSKAIERYKVFGVTSDFVMKKKSKSFNRFRNKKEFNSYLHAVQHIASGSWEKRRIRIYKENYIQSLRNAFNSSSREAIRIVRNMSDKEFKYRVESEQLPDIAYNYYDPDNQKLKYIMESLNEKVHV